MVAIDPAKIQFDIRDGGVHLFSPEGPEHWLHPLWLHERAVGPLFVDPVNGQRVFDPSATDSEIAVKLVERGSSELLTLTFTDGDVRTVSVPEMLIDLGVNDDPQSPPQPQHWDASLQPRPEAEWQSLSDPRLLRDLLNAYFRYGFCIIRNTPVTPGSLRSLAEAFGYIRETNFGVLFDVVKKPHANDLAYTNSALAAHTDNPYRMPVPCIQFLHCLQNTVDGGLSTLVDGFALVEKLICEAPEEAAVLEKAQLRFRYESKGGAIMQNYGSIIERNSAGQLKQVRLSSRLDFPPALPRREMDLFYAGRRRLQKLAGDPAFEIRFRFEPGLLLMMDNHRTLHGRTRYDDGAGHRHLQGCYIDHDGPDSLYRMLVRDGAAKVGRDVA